jgi:hypothetical protein
MVYQQTQRWLRAGIFEAMAHDLHVSLRLAKGRANQPLAAILDGRTLQSAQRVECERAMWCQTQTR